MPKSKPEVLRKITQTDPDGTQIRILSAKSLLQKLMLKTSGLEVMHMSPLKIPSNLKNDAFA